MASNRSNAGKSKRKGRALNGGKRLIDDALDARKNTNASGNGSIRLRHALKNGVIDSRGNAVAMSRIPRAWSDTHRKVDIHHNGYHADYLFKAISVRSPIIKTVGVTKTFIGLEWRGEPCLFDDCMGKPTPHGTRKHAPVGVLPPYRVISIVKPSQLAADAAVAAWRGAQQLAWAEMLLSI